MKNKTIIIPPSADAPTVFRSPRTTSLSANVRAVIRAIELQDDGEFAKLVNVKSVGMQFDTDSAMHVTPLLLACGAGYETGVAMLINAGADINAVDLSRWGDKRVENWGGSNCLHYALEGGPAGSLEKESHDVSISLLKRLIKAGANVNQYTGKGTTVIDSAVRSGSHDAVRRLLKAGANPNMIKKGWIGPLSSAIDVGDIEMAGILVDGGYDVSMNGHLGGVLHNVALADIASDVKIELCEFLVYSAKADPMLLDPDGRTFLFSAIAAGDIGLVRWIVKRCKKVVSVSDPDGVTPGEWAKSLEMRAMIPLLK